MNDKQLEITVALHNEWVKYVKKHGVSPTKLFISRRWFDEIKAVTGNAYITHCGKGELRIQGVPLHIG